MNEFTDGHTLARATM